MCSARIDFQLTVHVATQRVLRQHAFDRGLDHALRGFSNQLFEVDRLDAARETGVGVVDFVGGFSTGYTNLLGIDNDDVIAGVNVRSVLSFMLATQTARDFGGQTTQGLTCSVDDKPVALYCFRFSSKSFHSL